MAKHPNSSKKHVDTPHKTNQKKSKKIKKKKKTPAAQ
tara:strand:- start:165 stop:275 length:111 start_codon:yes stop_codon:yes gene_type:complete